MRRPGVAVLPVVDHVLERKLGRDRVQADGLHEAAGRGLAIDGLFDVGLDVVRKGGVVVAEVFLVEAGIGHFCKLQLLLEIFRLR